VNFDVPEGVLFDRLSLRALTSGRKDDNPETIRNRINVFYESTAPVVEMYSKLGKVGNVSGLGEIEDIYQRVR
jgi:adenylate kinase